jgi:hypothetical protein
MTDVTLLEKSYGSFSQHTFEAILSSMCKDLRVKIKVKEITTRDWIRITVSGEDESIALRLLEREFGLAPITADKVAKFSTVCGKVVEAHKAIDELRVDIGIFQPKVFDAIISLPQLRAQLADGKDLPLKKLIELFCLHSLVPLHIKLIADLNTERVFWEAELSEKQLSQFSGWLRSNLDRLIVLGASISEVERALNRARHFRDVAKIETLGSFEHAILCKLGTDAAGLVPRLGPHLRSATLAPFSPRKINTQVMQGEYWGS